MKTIRIGNCLLINGDCQEVIKELEDNFSGTYNLLQNLPSIYDKEYKGYKLSQA